MAAAEPMPSGAINQPTCFPIATTPGIPVNSRDVAVSPVDHSVYVTLNILNRGGALRSHRPHRIVNG